MYTCSLQGCKSAWGESDSMVNHLCGNKLKHNKNFIIYHMRDPRGASLTKNEVMDLSEDLDNQGLDTMCFLILPSYFLVMFRLLMFLWKENYLGTHGRHISSITIHTTVAATKWRTRLQKDEEGNRP